MPANASSEPPSTPGPKVLNIREAWAAWNGYKFAEYYYEAEYEYFCVRNPVRTYDIMPDAEIRNQGS